MRSSILIVSYLWKDTWSRWLEQPSSILARLFVGALLVVVTTVILVAFSLLERSVRLRLENFGLNTLVVRENVSGLDPELLHNADRPDRLAPLQAAGQKLRLRQLFVRAQTEFQNEVPVMSYPPEALPKLAEWLGEETPLIYFNERLPENILLRVSMGRQSGMALVRRMGDFLRPVGIDNLLLVPQGWASDMERIGFTETTVFQRQPTAMPMARYVDAVNLLYSADRRSPPQLQSALPLLRELERLQGRQQQWRTLLAATLGAAVALVFGAIAVLEFRQNLFIGALLRSLGAPAIFLYFRQWLENAFLANVAAIGAIGLVAGLHAEIFGALGFPSSVLNFSEANPYWSIEIALTLICVNIGAFLSSLPVAVGLRRPVGSILN
jgi:hypothetical protein